MRKRIGSYVKGIDALLAQEKIKNIDKVIADHLVKISFYQHERLIHLIVTLFFSLFSLFILFYMIENPSVEGGLLTFLFLLMLIFYIIHYYYLENYVQKMYSQYDQLLYLDKKNQNK